MLTTARDLIQAVLIHVQRSLDFEENGTPTLVYVKTPSEDILVQCDSRRAAKIMEVLHEEDELIMDDGYQVDLAQFNLWDYLGRTKFFHIWCLAARTIKNGKGEASTSSSSRRSSSSSSRGKGVCNPHCRTIARCFTSGDRKQV